jgi:outer membrane protein
MSKSFRARLLAAACGLGITAGLATAVHAESLADAIALAYQTNPTLQAQRATQRALDENVVQAKAGFRPTVSGTVSHQDVNLSEGADRVQDNKTVSFSQPLYTGGRASAALSASQADVQAGLQNVRRVESVVLLNVITAYVDVRRTLEALRISQDNVARLRRQLEESQARFDVGDVTRTDVAQAQARFAAAQAGLSTAQANLGIARASYAALVGQSPADLAPEPSLGNILPATIDEAFAEAERNNPQILGAEFTEQASRARVSQARAARRPTVSFNGNVTESTGAQFANNGRTITTTFQATMPLFTGGLTSSQIRAALERNNADRLTLENTRRTVLQSVSQAWNQLLGARAGLVSNEEQVRATKLAYEGVKQEQEVGLRTTIDVLNAEQELRNAEFALVGSRRDEYVAASAVLSAMGKLDAATLTPEVPQYDAAGRSRRAGNNLLGWAPSEPAVRLVDKVGAPFKRPAPDDGPIATAPISVTDPEAPPVGGPGPPPLPPTPQ